MLPVGVDVSHSLEQGCGVEVLSVNMPVDVGLSEELLLVGVFDPHARSTCAFGVELVCEL